ncbi:MAG: hypothetical protein E4H40_03065 [Candidatus Brocadiia bacterium]|nr:MAG: hypothetical protein E4H40_03065 [Candidatus Brocadiia bacterium]
MAKHKSGLHKEISSIFDGVPMPNKNDSKQGSSEPSAVRAGYVPPRPPVSAAPSQTPQVRPQSPKPQLEEKNTPMQESVPAKVVRESEITEKYKPKGETALKQILENIKGRFFAMGDSEGSAKQKVMALLIPVLAIAMIFLMIRAFSTPRINAAVNIVPSGNKTVESGIPKTEWKIPDIYPSTLRDPMQLVAASTSKYGNGQLVITGILYSEDKASAVINGRIVYQGDEVLGAKIMKIERKSIEFEMDGKTWTQKVQE